MIKRTINFFKNRNIEIASLIGLIVIWQLVADYVVQRTLFLPSFTEVISALVRIIETGVLFTDIQTSLLHFGIGIGSALIVGIPIGVIMGWFTLGNRIFDPIVEILRPIPPLAWIPFALIWLGLTHTAAGFVVFVGAVFPIVINTYTGFKSTSRIYVEAAKVLGCVRDRDLISKVAFPSSMPSITAGIRIGMGVGWMCLVAAELFGVSRFGLGYKIWFHYSLHQMDFVLTYMLILGIIGLLIDKGFRFVVDTYLLKWRKGVVV